ncbi:unnamed protein product, partial [Menidia menidia]
MMVASFAGEGEVSNKPRSRWSPGFALAEEVQHHNLLFMDDNAHHISPELSQLNFRKSECFIWYGQQCPHDLKPKEHVWDQLKQRLYDSSTPPCDLAELRVVLVEEMN